MTTTTPETPTSTAQPGQVQSGTQGGAVGAISNYLDERTSISAVVKEFGRKIFPDHWSFMLGEVALYSFVVILISGSFLTFFFQASMAEVVYDGSYVPLKGLEMSAAMNSALDISFDVRGGLLMRQVHHWAALLFVASIGLHMLRIYFTGAFRKPRELNWVIGFILFVLAMGEGFTGYSLPDDLLSGNGLRIIDGLLKGIPVIGTWISYLLFGGEFPGTQIVGRLYTLHILLLPALVVALIALHLVFVVVHKHTQYPGPGKTNNNVVGYPILPVYAAKAGGFFFIVFGVIMLMAAFFTINPIWAYGPYDPSPVSAGTQPDWYIGFADGALRLIPPGWEWTLGNFTFSLNVFLPVVVLGLFIVVVMIYPFFEAWVTGDKREHHLLDRPRNAPTRTAIGAAGVTFYASLWAAASSDLIATHFKMAMEHVIHVLQFMTRRSARSSPSSSPSASAWRCRRRIARSRCTASSRAASCASPAASTSRCITSSTRTSAGSWSASTTTSRSCSARTTGARSRRAQRVRAAVSRWFFEDRIEPVTRTELEAAHGHGEHGDHGVVEAKDEAMGGAPHIRS